MKNTTPFQIVLLAVFGALGVAGVLIFAIVASSSNNQSVGAVVMWGTLDESRVQAVMRAAAETDDRLNGVTYVKKDPVTYENDLVNALASGTGPDLFIMTQDWAVHDAAKTMHIPFSSLSQTQFSTTFLAAAAPYIGDDGIIAVPLVADPLVLFWNQDLLSAAQMTTPPKYWYEFPAAAQKLTQKSDSGTIKVSGVAIGEYQNVDSAKDILSILILQSGGGITARDAAGRLVSALSPQQGAADQPSLAALRFYTTFADPSQDSYTWNRSLPKASVAFAQGSVALYIGHASEAAAIKLKNPNLNFAMAPLPQLRADSQPLNFATVYGLAIPRTAKNPQGARTVAYILASPSVSQGFASVLGMASALRGVVSTATNPLANPRAGTLDAILATAPKSTQDLINSQAYISTSWSDPDPQATDDIFRAMIESTVNGALKAQDALSRADKALNQLLGL